MQKILLSKHLNVATRRLDVWDTISEDHEALSALRSAALLKDVKPRLVSIPDICRPVRPKLVQFAHREGFARIIHWSKLVHNGGPRREPGGGRQHNGWRMVVTMAAAAAAPVMAA